MWPFRKWEPKPYVPTWKDLAVQRMREWRPIGGSFKYLGREFVVTGYHRYEFDGIGGHCIVELSGDYADDTGRIRSLRFPWPEAQALMERNP